METTYLFYVHSNVTIYLVKYYIMLHKVPPSNILILFDRLTELDVEVLPGKKIDFSKKIKNVHLNKKNFWPSLNVTNKFINSEVKNQYFFFVPHILTESLQLFAANKKCKKVIYIEEGDMSYFSENLLNERFCNSSIKANLLRKLYSCGILYKKHPFPKINKKEEAICLHQNAFPFRNFEKHIYNFKDVFFVKNFPHKENFDSSIIFLLDPFYPKEEEEKKLYYTTLRSAFIYIKNYLGSIIYFKPHPVLSGKATEVEVIFEIASECGLTGILTNTPVELIIARFTNVKVVTHFSSLIRYCFYANIKPYFWGFNLIKNKELESPQPKPMIKFILENRSKIEIIPNYEEIII